MSQKLLRGSRSSLSPSLTTQHLTVARSRLSSVTVKAQRRISEDTVSVAPVRQGELRRRELSYGLMTAALTCLTAAPAEALFGIGGNKEQEYATETTDLLGTVRSVVSLDRDDPQREGDVSRVRGMTNTWVAKYRRDNTFAGRPSYSNTYSVVNALAGHFNSFGTEAPLPKKRLERLLKARTVRQRRE